MRTLKATGASPAGGNFVCALLFALWLAFLLQATNLMAFSNTEPSSDTESENPLKHLSLQELGNIEVTTASKQPERVMNTSAAILLRNAWKYTSRREHARIELGREARNGRIVYFVRDDGSGFDQRSADRLFQPFQRLHPAAEFPGNGIGLATVRRIVQRHGGEVWAEGAVEKGATFYFTLESRSS
jgi:signal transduction histidine kinase